MLGIQPHSWQENNLTLARNPCASTVENTSMRTQIVMNLWVTRRVGAAADEDVAITDVVGAAKPHPIGVEMLA